MSSCNKIRNPLCTMRATQNRFSVEVISSDLRISSHCWGNSALHPSKVSKWVPGSTGSNKLGNWRYANFFPVNGRNPKLATKTQASGRNPNPATETQFNGRNPNLPVEAQKEPVVKTIAVKTPPSSQPLKW